MLVSSINNTRNNYNQNFTSMFSRIAPGRFARQEAAKKLAAATATASQNNDFYVRPFAPAKSVEGAIGYAKSVLGVDEGGLLALDNVAEHLPLFNLLNEALVTIWNKTKGGIKLPNEIFLVPTTTENNGAFCAHIGQINGKIQTALGVFPNLLKRLDKEIASDKGFKNFIDNGERANFCRFLFHEDPNYAKFLKLAEQYKKSPETMDIKSKWKLLIYSDNIRGVLSSLDKYPEYWSRRLEKAKNMGVKEASPFGYIDHEVAGHMAHVRSCDSLEEYNLMNVGVNNRPMSQDLSVLGEFRNNRDKQIIASQVSEYAKKSPGEFVAEVSHHRMAGNVLPEDIMELYESYKGPAIKL